MFRLVWRRNCRISNYTVMPGTEARVIDVPADRVEEAVKLLAHAFADDPLMCYLFADEADYETCLRGFFHYSCTANLIQGWPLIGLIPRSQLAAVAVISMPDPSRQGAEDDLAVAYAQLSALLSRAGRERLERYAARAARLLPDQPMLYITAIGVRPQSQGRGYARRLLDDAQRRAEEHPKATGVGLDTENPENVRIYEQLGYRVVAEERIGDVRVWGMFRPNER